MDIKVVYLGDDSGYFYKLKDLFLQNYEGNNFDFIEIASHSKAWARDYFIQLYELRPQILYIDFEYNTEIMIDLAKLLNRNNEMRLISFVGLYSVNQSRSVIMQGVSAAIRLNHIKSIEVEDVVYDAMSLIDVNFAEYSEEFVHSEGELVFEVLQPLRIGYIEDNRFHVETNSYLAEGEIVKVFDHPLMKIMPSTKVYVEKFYDSDMYFNRRFAYDLEFIYIDNDFFAATNERWKLYKQLKAFPEKMMELPPEEKEEIIADMQVRQQKFGDIKFLIDRWLKEREGKKVPKKLKIMIIDNTLDVLRSLTTSVAKFPYSIYFQTLLLNDFYQIKRSTPHLIVMRVTDINTIDTLEQMIAKVKFVENYNPYILVFGCDEGSDELRRKFSYDKLMASKNKMIDVESIKKFATALDDKLAISVAKEKRVFFKSSDSESLMFLTKFNRIYSMNESELILQSSVEIPMWTVFLVNSPVKVFLTVVPHLDNSAYGNQEGFYRCLINGAGELEKAAIRRVINSTLSDEDEDSSD